MARAVAYNLRDSLIRGEGNAGSPTYTELMVVQGRLIKAGGLEIHSKAKGRCKSCGCGLEAATMKNAAAKKTMSTGTAPAGVPPLPELEHAKNAVLNSLESLSLVAPTSTP